MTEKKQTTKNWLILCLPATNIQWSSLYTMWFLHRFCSLCACSWWWSLTCCPEWAERLPMVYTSCWKPMLPTSTPPTTGTHFLLYWSASVLESNLQLHCRSPAAALTVTQVKTMSWTFLKNYAGPAVQGAPAQVIWCDDKTLNAWVF